MKNAFITLFNFIVFVLWFQLSSEGQNMPNSSGPPAINFSVTMPSQSYSPTQGSSPTFYFNYDRTWVPQIPVTNSNNSIFSLGSNNNSSQIASTLVSTYKNGWGAPIQQIARGGYLGNNVVSPSDLRPSITKTDWLPYTITSQTQFQLTAFSDENTYYNTPANGYSAEGGTSYSQTIADYSSGTPTSNTYMPGASFVGQNVGTTSTVSYNLANDVLNFTIGSYGSSNLPVANGYYNPNMLTLKTSNNANGLKTEEYYDMDNLLVCKRVLEGTNGNNTPHWLSTYYVYNDMKKLAFMLPPTAVEAGVVIFPYLISTTTVNNLCYSYVYDQFGMLITQGIPGQTGYNYTVYDSKHRPVLYQSPLLNSTGQWKFFIYDTKDRVVMSGLVTSSNAWTDWMNALFPTNYTYLQNNTPGTLLYYLITDFNGTYPTAITNCDIQIFNYYDQYPSSDPVLSAAVFNNNFTSDYINLPQYVMPPSSPCYVTNGLLTASKVEVINNTYLPSAWIYNVYYYDQKSRLIQKQTVNPLHPSYSPVWDVTTYQYLFTGQKALEIMVYNDDATNTKPSTKIKNEYVYDINDNGRLKYVWQALDNNGYKEIAEYQYDDFGRVRFKNLGGVEARNYSYNIRGQLSGINSDYAQNGSASPQATNTTFGCTLSYDYGFSMPRTDGKISGMTWRGSDVSYQRAYGYEYDIMGRLTSADFNEQWTNGYFYTSWNHSSHDYSMSNVSYDDNGNMLTMNQRGNPLINPTTPPGPVPIDVLTYNYIGNQLQYVADSVKTNYGLGDFQDVTVNCNAYYSNPNGPPGPSICADYAYDVDGNLASDSNKHITNISYNYQDLPVSVSFANGSYINNTYDANGTLLVRNIHDPTQTPVEDDWYRYFGPFVNRNDSLLYLLHDEGRARWRSDSSFFSYDFFVTDHVGNVRSVVTANPYSPLSYWAGYEVANANFEDAIFNNVSNIASAKPDGSSGDQMAGLMNGADSSRIGTSIMLHVMSGDKFDLSIASYWDQDSSGYADSSTMASSLFATLLMGDAGEGMGGESGASGLVSSMYNSLSANLGAFQGIVDEATDSAVPMAYLNYLVFDENMNFLPQQSGAVQVGPTPGAWQTMQVPTITAQQNGYLVVYASNVTLSPVWMDHFSIYVYQGNLLQEQNYYPYGLSIKEGQSSNPLSQPSNYKFETNQNNEKLGLCLDDFNFRQYDYQTGRFINIDPMADEGGQEVYSPYHFCANDPANYTDPMGLDGHVDLPGVTITGQEPTQNPIPTSIDGGMIISSGWSGPGSDQFNAGGLGSGGANNSSAPQYLTMIPFVSHLPVLSIDPIRTEDAALLNVPEYTPTPSPSLTDFFASLDNVNSVLLSYSIPTTYPTGIGLIEAIEQGAGKVGAAVGAVLTPALGTVVGTVAAVLLPENWNSPKKYWEVPPPHIILPVATTYFAAEHTKGARPSTKGKHEKGTARKIKDSKGYKGYKRVGGGRPNGWKGKWPPQ